MKYKVQKVNIHGHDFWYLPTNEDCPNGSIAPLHHCDANGELDPLMMFSSETYAHVYDDGIINRHGREIGKIDELLK